ncbi:hypothetical protein AB6A40_003433 [Gnathostoma spinigerum]|uniref:5'-AMP-activated protein kinase subunit beta-1 n=1 Tax=Gnathostoma spinigerum TaxID=75299 RepID=A0ABD6E9I6_9BILA
MGGIITRFVKFVVTEFRSWGWLTHQYHERKLETAQLKSAEFTTNIRWIAESESNEVKIAISTNDWKPLEMRKIDDKTFIYEINLPESTENLKTIEFKFLVDGSWRTSNEYKTCPNGFGTVNNVITIQ